MNTSGSSVYDLNGINICKEFFRQWKIRRYRGRICCLSPETWLAFGYFLLVTGWSLLSTGYFFTSGEHRMHVMKFGIVVLCFGWATLVFVIERVRYKIFCSRFRTNNTPPRFVGVCISPPIQPEFLSAMLLPEINREWVSVENLPGFERSHADIVPPPTQQATAGEENCEESRSKRRRNRKKKANSSFSELDSASQELNESIVQTARADANQEDSQLGGLRIDGDPPSKLRNPEREDFNKPNKNSEQQSLKKSSQPTESNPDGNNLNNLISQEKDKQVRNRRQAGNPQPSSRLNNTIYKDNSSPDAEENTFDYNHKDSLQTANRLFSEEKSVKTTVNFVTCEDQQEKLELALSGSHRNKVDDSSKQLKVTPDHLSNITEQEGEKPADQTTLTDATSTEARQVFSKPVSPNFITFTSKKKNRRRKK